MEEYPWWRWYQTPLSVALAVGLFMVVSALDHHRSALRAASVACLAASILQLVVIWLARVPFFFLPAAYLLVLAAALGLLSMIHDPFSVSRWSIGVVGLAVAIVYLIRAVGSMLV
jgi:hypothetical protein